MGKLVWGNPGITKWSHFHGLGMVKLVWVNKGMPIIELIVGERCAITMIKPGYTKFT